MTSQPNEYYIETKEVIDNIEVRRPHGGKRKCAIFVMVQNENIFLPMWLKYYSNFFDGEDIYVFDHRSTDTSVQESAAKFSFNAIRLEYPFSFDHQWFQYVAQNTVVRLLEFYDYVIFNDIDEILFIKNKQYKNLGEYIHKLDKERVRCIGYDLIHVTGKEKPFNFKKPVLSQRKYWYRTRLYDKTLITSTPIHWNIGFHSTKESEVFWNKDLFLIHLHKLDYDMCEKKSFERSKLPWTDMDKENKWGWQNRITDAEKFREYFYHWPNGIEIVKIPRAIRKTKLF